MKLNLQQMRQITRGVTDVREEEGYFRFFRFSPAEEKAYLDSDRPDYMKKVYSTAGVRLAFRSDTRQFNFRYQLLPGSSRPYGSFDCYVDGVLIFHKQSNHIKLGEGSVRLSLEEGEKTIELYLPWSMIAKLTDVEIDDGATLIPARRKHTMLIYGDSITHGYDVSFPSLSYASKLSEYLDADAINKGIGGEIFFPELLAEAADFSPDYISVAYGTNDWACRSRELTQKKCRAFYTRLSALYPDSVIFALAPIWREQQYSDVFGGAFSEIAELIRQETADLANVRFINCFGFVPQIGDFFSDDPCLHPNDLGFSSYARNLEKAIQKYL